MGREQGNWLGHWRQRCALRVSLRLWLRAHRVGVRLRDLSLETPRALLLYLHTGEFCLVNLDRAGHADVVGSDGLLDILTLWFVLLHRPALLLLSTGDKRCAAGTRAAALRHEVGLPKHRSGSCIAE